MSEPDDTPTRLQHVDEHLAQFGALWKGDAEWLRAEVSRLHEERELDIARLETLGKFLTRAEAEVSRLQQDLTHWREWSQKMFLGGGPVTRNDGEQRYAMCAALDVELDKKLAEGLAEAKADVSRLRDYITGHGLPLP